MTKKSFANLVHCEPDIPTRQEPLVYPVFGRGRSLLPMIGAGIIADNIQEYAEFLVGACSCEIKEQNPGFDLSVAAANWDVLLKSKATSQPRSAAKTLCRRSRNRLDPSRFSKRQMGQTRTNGESD